MFITGNVEIGNNAQDTRMYNYNDEPISEIYKNVQRINNTHLLESVCNSRILVWLANFLMMCGHGIWFELPQLYDKLVTGYLNA